MPGDIAQQSLRSCRGWRCATGCIKPERASVMQAGEIEAKIFAGNETGPPVFCRAG
jgi:hypothetical protein